MITRLFFYLKCLFLFLFLVIVSPNFAIDKKDFLLDLTQLDWYAVRLEDDKTIYDADFSKGIKIKQFPVNLNIVFNIPPSQKINRFVLETEFDLPEKVYSSNKALSMHFGGIGQNFEIYLNGELLVSEIHVSNNRIYKLKTIDGLLLNPSKTIFNKEKNKLLVYIIGKPPGTFLDKNHLTGLYYKNGYFVSYSEYAIHYNDEDFTIILNGVYLFIGFFYLFIYSKTKVNKFYLYFGLYAVLLATYLFHRTFSMCRFYDDLANKNHTEYTVLMSLIPVFLLFLQELFFSQKKTFLISKIIIYTSATLAISLLLLDERFHRTILKLWQYSSIPSLIVCLFILLKALWNRKPLSGQISIGFVMLFIANVWDILDAITFNTGFRISQYGFFAFVVVLILVLTNDLLNYQMEIEKQKNAFVKFVPLKFIELLDKKSIIDLSLGDQIQQEMTILFSDIRAFTSLSEQMTPKENFDFINTYLNYSSPVIRNNKGFIDKYLGDGIMAIFPYKPENAIDAAIEKLKSVQHYNDIRVGKGLKPIRVGIGIHTGNLMLGIIGENERYECTVISDAVNLASRIEGLTKIYSAGILISEFTYNTTTDIKKYHIRYIDKVAVKGKQQPVKIYEVLDGLSNRVMQKKLETIENFEKGVREYGDKNLDTAKNYFIKVLQSDPLDKAAELYITRIEFFQLHGIPLEWEGIERLEHK